MRLCDENEELALGKKNRYDSKMAKRKRQLLARGSRNAEWMRKTRRGHAGGEQGGTGGSGSEMEDVEGEVDVIGGGEIVINNSC